MQYLLINATLSAALLRDLVKQHEVAPQLNNTFWNFFFFQDVYDDIESDITSNDSDIDERNVFDND